MSTKRRSWSVEQKLQLIQEEISMGLLRPFASTMLHNRYSTVGRGSSTMMGYRVCSPSTTALIRK